MVVLPVLLGWGVGDLGEFSRDPARAGYVGLGGLGMFTALIPLLIWSLVFVLLRMRQEERLLAEHFGSEFESYLLFATTRKSAGICPPIAESRLSSTTRRIEREASLDACPAPESTNWWMDTPDAQASRDHGKNKMSNAAENAGGVNAQRTLREARSEVPIKTSRATWSENKLAQNRSEYAAPFADTRVPQTRGDFENGLATRCDWA